MEDRFKFRVWEPLNKKLYYLNMALYERDKNNRKQFALPIEHQGLSIGSYTSMNLDALIIMQCTAIKDINDKLVYEGDIVRTHSGLKGRITFGAYNDDEFECYSYGWYWVGKDKENQSYFLGFDPEWGGFEVIGNIYENQELLDCK